MSLGDLKDYGGKGSNYNWQLRMLQLLSACCIPVLTENEKNLLIDVPIGKIVYQSDGAEGLYVYKSTGWTFIA